jgi:hypothetical protein
MDLSKFQKLNRLGRNLKVGDVVGISEHLDRVRYGHAEITGAPIKRHAHFSADITYTYPIKVVSGEGFHSVVWTCITFYSTTRVDLFRPKAVKASS